MAAHEFTYVVCSCSQPVSPTQNIASSPEVLYPFITLATILTLDFFFLHTVAAPVGPVVPTPTVLPMGAPVPRPRGPPPPPGDENREVRDC